MNDLDIALAHGLLRNRPEFDAEVMAALAEARDAGRKQRTAEMDEAWLASWGARARAQFEREYKKRGGA